MELNRIYCMDCIKGMRKLPAHSVDLIVTDPPFKFTANGSGFVRKANKKIFHNIDDSFGHDFNPLPFLNASKRVMKKFNLYVWCSKELVDIYIGWARKNKFLFNILTWHKENPLPLWNNTYMSDTEYLIFIREPGAYFNSKLADYRMYKKYWITNIGLEMNGHPTVKPREVIRPSILISSKPGDVVLDCFMGSGTTAAVCKELGRNFIGFEIEQKWIDIAEKRLSQSNITSFF